MRWRTLANKELHPLHWLWLWLPALVLIVFFLGPLLATDWLEKKKRACMGPSKEWRPWFAWYPVELTFVGETVWLEWIERRIDVADWKEYRPTHWQPLPEPPGQEGRK